MQIYCLLPFFLSPLLAQIYPTPVPIYNRYKPYLPNLCDNQNVGPRAEDSSCGSDSTNPNLGPSSFGNEISSCVNVGHPEYPCPPPVNIYSDHCHGPDIHDPLPPQQSTICDTSSSSHCHGHKKPGCGRPYPPPPCPPGRQPSKLDLSSSLENICMKPNSGWYKFYYGNEGTVAWQTYSFDLPYQSVVTLTDCFCPGDRFQLIDNGRVLLNVNQCPQPEEPCTIQNQLADPDQCVNNGAFCSGSAILPPGPHNLTIGVLDSGLSAGAAFLRLDEICYIQNGSFEQAVPCCYAREQCNFQWWEYVCKDLMKSKQ